MKIAKPLVASGLFCQRQIRLRRSSPDAMVVSLKYGVGITIEDAYAYPDATSSIEPRFELSHQQTNHDIQMGIITLILIILIGLAIGSFLNVCIYRIPQKKSILFPPSHCPKCEAKIRAVDNIPLISYIILRGKCRNCKAKISLQYPLVEFITPTLLVLTYLRFGLTWGFAARSILILFMILTFFIDLKHRIIPDVLTLPGIILGFLLSFVVKSPSFLNSFLGIIVGGGMFYLSAVLGELLFKKESMGGGDIKLAMMLGAFLGWQKILLVLLLSAFLGSLIGGIALFFSKDVKETKAIPFGPFLALGAVIAMFLGDALISAYLKTFF